MTDISECLLECMSDHFGGVKISPLTSGPSQASVADGLALYGLVSDYGRPAGDASGAAWAYQFPGGFCDYAWF